MFVCDASYIAVILVDGSDPWITYFGSGTGLSDSVPR